jgi:hypothetical protein
MTLRLAERGARSRPAVDRLIAETGRQSAEFPQDLANHLPMLLTILDRLGAPPERLARYAERYNAENHVPPLAPEGEPIHGPDWRRELGRRNREAALRAFFCREAGRLGPRRAIRLYVPQLAEGVAASALHALMRLAYGVMRDDADEIGIALGYWAAAYLPMPAQPGRGDMDDPLAVLLLMRTMPAFGTIRPPSDLLWHWMRAVGQHPALPPLTGRLRIGPDALDRLADASLALYASTMSFEALHALTGAHWLRQIVPLIDDPAPLLRTFWHAIMAVYPKLGMPLPVGPETLAAWRRLPVPPDEAVAARAIASDDEHDPSLVFSAWQEHARTGDPLYKVVAARRVGLLS